MAYDQIYAAGATSQMIEVALRSSSTGQLLTGVAYGSITAKYIREGAASQTTVSVVTMTQGTFASGGWVETGIAGVYQFGIPNAAIAAGAKAVTLVFSASGAIDVVKRVVLVVEDLRDVLVSSRLAPTDAGRTLDILATGEASANVTLWKGTAPEYLDANNLVQSAAVLSDNATHGGAGAVLQLKKVYINNDDYGGKAVEIIGTANEGKGVVITGRNGNDIVADIVGNLTGTVDEVGALNSNAQQNVADALKSAPTAGDPTPGSVYAYLAAAEPADIWSYVTRTLTQSSTSTTDSTTAGSISRRRGDSWSISLTLGAITGYTSLWFTVKAATSDADTAAIFQIKKNASGSGDGLLYVNGATASSAALGSITVSDATTGAVIIALDETITDDLTPASYSYDCQALISGSVSTPDSGTFTITADVTRVVV